MQRCNSEDFREKEVVNVTDGRRLGCVGEVEFNVCDGKMIYDGDIIRISYNGKHLFDATVEWIDRYGGFYMNEGDGCYSPIPHDYVTVIGNVFHDKELIER